MSIVGLFFTYREARKSRTAAEAARIAAEDARRTRQLVDVSLDLAAISGNLSELKATIRSDEWSLIDQRIDAVCRALAVVREDILQDAPQGFVSADLKTLTDATPILRGFQERLTAKGVKPPEEQKGVRKVEVQIIKPLTELIDKVDAIRFRAKTLSVRRSNGS